MQSFTREELQLAKSVDLTQVATHLGFTVKKVGNYFTLAEMDSIRIYDKSHWYRWSRRESNAKNGGSQIDFLMAFSGLDVKEAVAWLLHFIGYQKNEEIDAIKCVVQKTESEQKKELEKKVFTLPEAASNNQYLYRYLMEERMLSKEVIDYFIGKGLIYEAKQYHNIVFKGVNKEGETKFASMRGVHSKPFKCDVAGNDKRYGFCDVVPNGRTVIVFESAIDLMSYVDMYDEYEEVRRIRFGRNKLALGMVSDAPLETFLSEYPQIEHIGFCLDSDKAGRDATNHLMEKYSGKGYQVSDVAQPSSYKDYNDWLKGLKLHAIELEEKQQEKGQLVTSR